MAACNMTSSSLDACARMTAMSRSLEFKAQLGNRTDVLITVTPGVES